VRLCLNTISQASLILPKFRD